MNSNTREDLKEFIRAVQALVQRGSVDLGYVWTSELIEVGDQLIQQLDKDETII